MRNLERVPGKGKDSPRKVGFPPIAQGDARLLVLGTLPGEDSLRFKQYYAHKHNAFWRLVAAVLGEDMPSDYAARQSSLIRNRWALWDVLESAERIGSSDAAIRNASANAFADFFATHREIEAVAFNGQKARALFKRHVVAAGIAPNDDVRLIDLPSSSPLHTMAFDDKRAIWMTELGEFGNAGRYHCRAK